ncbi:ribosome-recycling factor [Mycoplasma sp. SG1]|uniref:ribosome-recycling factor n=1 Tax=Mycoplasma sp. SG1 TaxID=2810348 RepID=UPI0020257278|nr:ribosome recycling factor [Mycoplasma sp. SG1]URM53231.1 ribosome-recycling factor [Mycoplasma sp. SG1]
MEQLDTKTLTKKLNNIISEYKVKISQIMSGAINTSILNIVQIPYYGAMMPLNQISNIKLDGANQIVVKPFDPSISKEIASIIGKLPIEATITVLEDKITLHFASLTEEKRLKNVKKVKELTESEKVKIRNIRHDYLKHWKDHGESENERNIINEEINKIIKNFQEKLIDLESKKLKSLMKI